MVWLEILVGLTLGTLASVCIAVAAVAPEEVRRLIDAVRAHLPASIRTRRLRRLSIDMIAELSVEVDMKWWDEQFAKQIPKPKKAIVVVPDRSRGLYPNSISGMTPDPLMAHMAHIKRLADDFARWEPGMPEWQRIKLARDIARGATPRDIGVAWDAAHTALAGHMRARLNPAPVEADCESCEYVEHHTYANATVLQLKTVLCQECRARVAEKTMSTLDKMLSTGVISAPEARAGMADVMRSISR